MSLLNFSEDLATNQTERVNGRMHAMDKRMIRSQADVNQLMPIRYEFAWEAYLAALDNTWVPSESPLQSDVAIWHAPDVLSPDERLMIKRSLGFFASSESVVANNILFAVYKHLTNPECRQYLLRQAFEEGVHTHTFVYIVEGLQLDQGEVFNLYREVPSVSAKSYWAIEHTRELEDPNFTLDSDDNIRRFLTNLVALYVCMESLWFYTGFAQILSLGLRGKMMAIAELYRWIMRDESIHFNFGIDCINQIRNENPSVWTSAMDSKITEMIKQAVDLEIAYARDSMPEPIVGINADMVADYMMFSANRRLEALDIKPYYQERENPFPWLAEAAEMSKSENFFEGKVTEYRKGPIDFGAHKKPFAAKSTESDRSMADLMSSSENFFENKVTEYRKDTLDFS